MVYLMKTKQNIGNIDNNNKKINNRKLQKRVNRTCGKQIINRKQPQQTLINATKYTLA